MVSETGPFAVRWLLQSNKWSLWHWTDDGKATLCAQKVRAGGEDLGLKEKEAKFELVDCQRCVVKHEQLSMLGL